jgi:hypothetical protein
VFQGTREQRLYDRNGYRGLGEIPDAVVIGAGRVAEIDVAVGFDGYDTFDAVVASFRFK